MEHCGTISCTVLLPVLLFYLYLTPKIYHSKNDWQTRGTVTHSMTMFYLNSSCASLIINNTLMAKNRWFASIPWGFKRYKCSGHAGGRNKRKWKLMRKYKLMRNLLFCTPAWRGNVLYWCSFLNNLSDIKICQSLNDRFLSNWTNPFILESPPPPRIVFFFPCKSYLPTEEIW